MTAARDTVRPPVPGVPDTASRSAQLDVTVVVCAYT